MPRGKPRTSRARPYRDRRHAGEVLARRLASYAGRTDVRVFALPRGGVPVAYEVVQALRVPLDVFVVRKLGVPGQEERAMGAIASGGVCLLDEPLVRRLGIPPDEIGAVVQAERQELARRERVYRAARPLPDVHGCTVLLIDDGLATGFTMRAAVRAVRTLQPARVVVAVPVAEAEICAALRREVDAVVCPRRPRVFHAVGQWYEDFSQTRDDEVLDLLSRAHRNEVAVPAG